MYLTRTPEIIKKAFPGAKWSSAHHSRLYLTFDDGPHPDSTPLLLALLDRLRLKATFFCLGEQIALYPELFNDIKEAEHQIGNHGYTHLSGWRTTYRNYLDNVMKGAEITSSQLYRPPYGRLTYKQYKTLSHCQDLIMWSHMPGDFDSTVSGEELYNRLCLTQRDQDIVVLHDNPNSINKVCYALEQLTATWSY